MALASVVCTLLAETSPICTGPSSPENWSGPCVIGSQAAGAVGMTTLVGGQGKEAFVLELVLYYDDSIKTAA